MSAQTLYDKLWQSHVVHTEPDGTTLLYIDRHLVHEVTSPQAFEGLRLAGRKPWRAGGEPGGARPQRADHRPCARASPTRSRACRWKRWTPTAPSFGITEFEMGDLRQGIVHVIGPEQGVTLPGMTVVCGDSHTTTHGAFGALAFGIGTSEVEHVLATQCLLQKKSKTMLVKVEGGSGQGRDRQGHRAGRHRRDRHRRRHRLCHRVRRRGDPRAVHGRAHDPVQHGDRGGCARRHGGGGRDHHRLHQGPPLRAQGRAVGPGGGLLAHAGQRCGRAFRSRWSSSTPRRSSRR